MDPSQSITEILDLEPLDSFVAIGYADYRDLLSDAIQQVPAGVEEIRAAVAAGDFTTVKKRAHSLKGMLSYFGCKTLTVRLAQMEQRQFDPSQADAVQSELLYYWERSLTAIKEWEKTIPGFAP